MQETEDYSQIIAVMCNADKRNMLLRLQGEDNMQILSPTIGDFEHLWELFN